METVEDRSQATEKALKLLKMQMNALNEGRNEDMWKVKA